MPNTFWLKDLHLHALCFQFTLPPTTLGWCRNINRCLHRICHEGGFWIQRRSFMTSSFPNIIGSLFPRWCTNSKDWSVRLSRQLSLSVNFYPNFIILLLHTVWFWISLAGRNQPSVQIQVQWNIHWPCCCCKRPIPADENKGGAQSASAVSSRDMSREVTCLCLCVDTYIYI